VKQEAEMGKPEIRWLNLPRDANYPAAQSYLTLCFPDKKAKSLVKKLKVAPMTSFKAKDIFRACRLTLLSMKNKHVDADLAKIEKGEELSPILLVRDPLSNRVIIADGFHRLSAVYALNEDADIPCKIV
jgi:disulfide oxidoreductase YuzD